MRDEFQEWDAKSANGDRCYDVQGQIIEDALADHNHRLNKLLEFMRERGEAAVYLCGTRLDSRYFFGNNDLGFWE